jgi:hypothetical protein
MTANRRLVTKLVHRGQELDRLFHAEVRALREKYGGRVIDQVLTEVRRLEQDQSTISAVHHGPRYEGGTSFIRKYG